MDANVIYAQLTVIYEGLQILCNVISMLFFFKLFMTLITSSNNAH